MLSYIMGFLFFSRSSARRRRVITQPYQSRKRRSNSYPLFEPGRHFRSFTRRFSTTIGWPPSTISTADIVAQAKMMCVQYVKCRLNKNAAFCRKYGLQVDATDEENRSVVDTVFPDLLWLGQELEGMYPDLYTRVGRQASGRPVMTNEKAVHRVVTGVARELAGSGITWAKVVSLFAVTGGLADDCVRQEHPGLLLSLVESMSEALDDHMADWIAHHGGWVGFLSEHKVSSFLSLVKADRLLATAASSFTIFAVLSIIILWLFKFYL